MGDLVLEIERSVTVGNNLEFTKQLISAKFDRDVSDLTNYECLLIEEKYVDCLTSYWLDEAPEVAVNLTCNNNILALIKKLKLLRTFDDCNNLLNTIYMYTTNYDPSLLFTYTFLLNEQFKTTSLLKTKELCCVEKFKFHCQQLLTNKFHNIKIEQNFVELLINLLKSSKSPKELCQSVGLLPIVNGFENTVNFEKVLHNLLKTKSTDEDFVRVQQLAKVIINKGGLLYFIKEITEIFHSYLDSTVLTEKKIDGRLILEVSGGHIVVSKIKEEIEQMLSDEIEEVRFVNANVIHIDADLSNNIWHGKNIVVYAETGIVSEDKSIIWDVSGKDAAMPIDSSENPALESGCEWLGADGLNGESGGNVLIMVHVLRNSHNFTVKSCGGSGSSGKDGKKGEDGTDGYCLDEKSFKNTFPPVSKYLNSSKKDNLKKTKEYIVDNFKYLEEFIVGNTDFGPMSKTEFESRLISEINESSSIYFKVHTNNGCKITFSFYNGQFLGCCQSFLLHEGSPGGEGILGGIGGRGGTKGHAGEVKILVNDSLHPDVVVIGNDGKEGLPGKPGPSGKPGKAGLDRGYKDFTVPFNNHWPKWVIPDGNENSKLRVSYSKEETSENVYCKHNNLYADIIFRKNEFNRVNTFRSSLRINNELLDNRKTHVQCKKTICEKSIKEQYPLKLSSVELSNLRNSIEEAETTLRSNSIDEISESEYITTELRVIRPITYIAQNVDFPNNLKPELIVDCNLTTASTNDSNGLSAAELVECVKRDPLEINNWTCMLKTRLNIEQLEVLWDIASTCEQLRTEEYNEQFKIAFCNKYQLAVLEYLSNTIDISDHCQTCKNDLVDVPLNCFDKIFSISIEDKTPGSDLEQFVVRNSNDDREFILSEFKKLFENSYDNQLILHKIVKLFLRECSSFSAGTLKTLEKVNSFRENHKHLLLAVLDSFKSALLREKDNSIFDELYRGIVDKNNLSMVIFENKVQRDKLLSTIYDLYVREHKKQYTLGHIFQDSNKSEISECLGKYFLDYGSLSACYREFLAYCFKTNLLVYSISETNQVTLIDNHNPRAETAMYFLLKDNKCVRLNINNEAIKLYNSQNNQGRLFNNIMVNIDSFTEKEQFDKFVANFQTSLGLYKDGNISKSLKISSALTYVFMEENNIRQILKPYLLEGETLVDLYLRLDKLKHEYTGCEMILHILALHFENEGNHVSPKELAYIISFVLKCALTMPHVTPLISWVLATQSQNQWLVEIILLKIELNLRKPLDMEKKSLWRGYLSKQCGNDVLMLLMEKICEETVSVTEKLFEETIFLLSNISQVHVGLEELDFTYWKYYLKNKFWAFKLMEIAKWSKEDLNLAAYHLVVLENLVGFALCMKLVEVLNKHKSELEIQSTMSLVPITFGVMSDQEVVLNDNLLELIKNENVSHWEKIIDKNCFNNGEERNVDTLVELIKSSGNTSDNVKNNLANLVQIIIQCNDFIKDIEMHTKNKQKSNEPIIHLEDSIKQVDMCSYFSELKNHFNKYSITDKTFKDLGQALGKIFYDSITSNTSVVSKPIKELNDVEFIKPKQLLETLFSIVVRTVEMKRSGVIIRDAQKLAIMTMLKSEKNILSQVSTGEGKSFIIVIFAIVKVLMNKHSQVEMKQKTVDIITSSHVLAERDAKNNKDIYNFFGINVGHNCYENIEKRKEVYSNNDVVYGELANFQRDYLLHDIYKKNIFGDRLFNTIIVDEVDSMLLDKGNNTLYLSHKIPGLDKLEPVFIFIWKSLHIPLESVQPKLELIVSLLKNRVLHEIFGIVSKENFKCLDTTIDDEIINNTWDFLVSEGFIDNSGKVLKQPNEDQFGTIPENCICVTHLKYIFKKLNAQDKSLIVPNYLKQYVEEHLEEWIKSGVRAMTMEPGVDYVVDIDRSESNCDRSPNIMIVDQDTGTDLKNSQWENGLHQFLQLKHGCRLSPISLKAVFISNVSYLTMYDHLYGLTGTLGSKVERKLLKDTYIVDFVTIPTAKKKCFTEELPILCSSRVDWYNTICEEAVKKTKQRSVLIVCETVNQVMTLKKELLKVSSNHIVTNIHTYTRDYEAFTIANCLKPGHIIISTNLAGRGTDINLSEELIKAGGLHVCLTYLPRNRRIEEQAFGRAARNGQPGSGQMIIFQTCTLNNALTIIQLKQQRDVNEVLRIADIQDYHKSRIQIEEECLKEFSDGLLIIESSNLETIESILLQVRLDQWAFWLEKNSNYLDVKSAKNFTTKISKLTSKNFDDWVQIIEDPFNLVKLGLALAEKKQYDKAIKLFDCIIEKEPLFSESAKYYRLYVNSKIHNISKEEITEGMNFVAKELMKQIDASSLAAYTIDCLKKKNTSILQIESFKEQQLNVGKINSVFVQSILNIVGKSITFEEFILPTIMDEETAFMVFNDLVRSGVILAPQIKLGITEKDIPFAEKYGLLPKDFSDFLKTYENKEFDEKKILEELEKKFLLPSRESFWSALTSKKILINEKIFCIVNMIKLKYVDPSLVNIVGQLNETYMEQQNEIWMYQPHEIGYSEDNCVLLQSAILIETIGELKYNYLLNKSIIYVNKVATLPKVIDNVEFDQFNSIKKEDFLKIGISSDTASKLICELEEQHIIEQKENTGKYVLLGQVNDLANIELSKYKAYSSDVIQLLKVCFSFKLALNNLNISKSKDLENNKVLCVSLPIRPHRNIINDLHNHEIVTKYVINPEVDITKELEALYPKVIAEENLYVKLFSNLYDENIAKDIIKQLISSEWLVKHLIWRSSYSVNMGKIKDQSLPLPLECYTETIKLVLGRQFDLTDDKGKGKKLKDHIESIIHHHTSMLYKVETPTFSLQPLPKELKKYKLPTSECRIFSLHGFDNILVLEEKKYTTKMIVSASSIALLGIAEITAGVVMSLFPLGPALISEGIGDIIYSMHSFYSGHFSWKNYLGNKAISLIISACCFFKPIEFFKSQFGKNLTSESSSFLSSVKTKCSSLYQKTKNFLSRAFISTPASTVIRSADSQVIVQTLTKQVITQTSVACGIGIASLGVDHFLEPQLERLGEELVERVLGDIDEIDSHTTISDLKEIYLLLDEHNATKIIQLCFTEVLDEHKNKNKNDWTVLFGKLKTTINKEFQNQIGNKNFSELGSVEVTFMLINIISKLYSVVSSSKNLLPMTIIPKVMNSMELTFQKKLWELRRNETRKLKPDSEVKSFISKMLDELKNGIKSVLNQNIHSIIVNPLMTNLKAKSGEYLMKIGSGIPTCSYYDEKDLENCIKQNEEIYKHTEFSQIDKLKYSSQKNCYGKDYNECLMELFRRKRSIPIFLEILKNCSSVNESFIELCLSAIPLILRQQGLNVPMLRVVIEKNGKQYIYGGNVGAEKNVITITISPEEAFLNNVQQNKILISNVLDTTYKKIVKMFPEYKGLTSDLLHKLIIRAVENDSFIQKCIITDSIPTTNIDSITKCIKNDNIDRKFIMQNTTEHENGQKSSHMQSNSTVTTACGKVHVKTISQSQVVKRQLIKVFKAALAKINHHLQSTQPHFKNFRLTLGDFIERKHVIIPNDTLGKYFDSYATGYELTVSLMEPHSELLLDYNVTMSLNDRCNTRLPIHGSQSPRIEYEILPVDIYRSKHSDNCIKGSILLDFECQSVEEIYSVNQCCSAGELVLPNLQSINTNRKFTSLNVWKEETTKLVKKLRRITKKKVQAEVD